MTLSDKIDEWASVVPDGVDLPMLYERLEYYERTLYEEYIPTRGADPDFLRRLDAWVSNGRTEDQQKTLFRLAGHLFFVGTAEFHSLYRTAMNGPIMRWLVDLAGIDISHTEVARILRLAARRTWFCGLTDSAQISHFCHANGLHGIPVRPDWQTMMCFGDQASITDYIARKQITGLVLMEDFVGSGEQMEQILAFTCQAVEPLPVLFLPLIACPEGLSRASAVALQHGNLQVDTVVALPSSEFIRPVGSPNEPKLYAQVRRLVQDCYPYLMVRRSSDSRSPLYGPFGFEDTGATLVTYSNCPDNTLPAIHYRSRAWEPLFPRSQRI